MASRNTPIFIVVTSGCLLLLLSFGYRSGFGLFLQPMSEANGWGRDVVSFALAIQNLTWGVVAVFAGGLADKYGLVKVVLAGIACYALGIIGMAYASNALDLIASAGILVGAGIAGTSFGIVLPALVRSVAAHKRYWILGVGTAAGSFGQFLLVPAMQEMIAFVGWFQALVYIGLSGFVMSLLVIPLAPYGGVSDRSSTFENLDSMSLLAIIRGALRVSSYRYLLLGFFVCGFHVAFITVHMPSYVVDLGFDARVGAWSVSLIGLCNIIGAYVSGILSGKYPKHTLLAWIYGGRVIAITSFLLFPTSLASILIFSSVMGFLWLATIPPTSGLVVVFFGTRYMAFLYGVVFFSHQLGSFSGVWLGGWLYELYNSYLGIWVAGIVFGIIAVLLHLPIQEKQQSFVSQRA